MRNPTAAILIIGDEILSGHTRDTNAFHLALELSKVGIDLKEIRMVADDRVAIGAALNALRVTYSHVFTSGGIGPTHDDVTADAVAAAFGVPVGMHEEPRAVRPVSPDHRGDEDRQADWRARVPEGAQLIENELAGAPGFSLGNVHALAGMPSTFRKMVAALLPRLDHGIPPVVREMRLEIREGRIATPLGHLAADFPDLAVGSYPFSEEGIQGTKIVIKGADGDRVEAALTRLAEFSTRY